MNEADSDSDNSDDIARGKAIVVNETGCKELRRYERMLAEDSLSCSMDTENDKSGLNN